MVLEKGPEIGSHVLSGAVFEPRSLDELFPSWRTSFDHDKPPLETEATKDRMYFMTERGQFRLPTPPVMHNRGNYIISLSDFARWLGRQAESLGVQLFPGFAGAELLVDEAGSSVVGVKTNAVGLNRRGEKKTSYQEGMQIRARCTVLAEGAHGSLTKEAKARFRLQSEPQTYGIGIKEVWEVPKVEKGLVVHSVGYPLRADEYGGGFAYHYGDSRVSLGLVLGLDYLDPFMNPYQEFQRMKRHPLFAAMLEGGRCVAYGARVINEGGIQCMPRLVFPGGLLVGCSAGFVNVPKIKGSHTAMKSGLLAAECIHAELAGGKAAHASYEQAVRDSWIYKELWRVRNVRPAFQRFGLYGGLLYAAVDTFVANGRLGTLHFSRPDHRLDDPGKHRPRTYPRPDNVTTFDLMTSVSRTGTNHVEDQPCHLQLKRPHTNTHARVEERFCPAGVYEYEEGEKLKINAQNCIHCKTCDIKDPSQNINWAVPEGGGGPKYTGT